MRRRITALAGALALVTGCSAPTASPNAAPPAPSTTEVPRLGDPRLYAAPTASRPVSPPGTPSDDGTAPGETDLTRLLKTPHAVWVTEGPGAATTVATTTRAAAETGTTAQLVVYAIPGRDCGLYSSGGLTPSDYGPWIGGLAEAVHGEPIIVLEPDALAQIGECDGQGDRTALLADAGQRLSDTGAHVYVDAGNSAWLTATEAAARLLALGDIGIRGFAVNVSNYRTTTESVAWAEDVSELTGGLHYVVDTSRNGNGPTEEWCNARGRALGEPPRLVEDDTALDALLWIKVPGESDGTCNGGPPAGTWWPEIAAELAAADRW